MTKGRYESKTTLLADMVAQSPGKSTRWYAERVGCSPHTTLQLLLRLKKRELATSRTVPDGMDNANLWYPTATLMARVSEGTLVDTHQVQIMHLLSDTPWLTVREISSTLSISVVTVNFAVRILAMRGELKRLEVTINGQRRPVQIGGGYIWALADEEVPVLLAEAS